MVRTVSDDENSDTYVLFTPERAREYLIQLFGRAGKGYGPVRGAQIFKRKALGLCGHTTIKSLDEISEILVEIGIASSLDEGRTIVPEIIGATRERNMYIDWGMAKHMKVEEAQDGRNGVRITAWSSLL